MLVEGLHHLEEVEERAREAVEAVDGDQVHLPRLDIGEEALERRTVEVRAGESAIVVALGERHPPLGPLALNVALDGPHAGRR